MEREGGGGAVYLLFWLVRFEYNSFEHFPNQVIPHLVSRWAPGGTLEISKKKLNFLIGCPV